MYNSINIIIPVYNEGENIERTLSEIEEKVKTPHKIFIIYDFNEDNTIPIVKKLMDTNRCIVLIKNSCGEGVLNAIRTGFAIIDEGAILVVMADLSDDLARVDDMFQKINEGYDIVCGSRYMRGGRQIGGPWLKNLLSRAAGISLYRITHIPTHDVTNSFKMYRKEVLNDIRIESTGGFEFGMEILVKAFLSGYKITEIPSTWRDRCAGESKFRLWRWLPKYLRWYCFGLIGSLKGSILFRKMIRKKVYKRSLCGR